MKLKIKGTSNTDRCFWIRVQPNNKSVSAISEILESLGIYDGLKTRNKEEELYLPKYKELEGDNYQLSSTKEERDIYIIFTTKSCNIIIFKDSKNFEKIKNLFLEKFDF
ncbi:hypothetical protein J4423_05610 [Candidatus Pacearchaeota archaeon]|nr:hypothetical protein [Candidatus Pacearchaeota archaeon]